MNDKHWSDRGQNSSTYNEASSKEKSNQEELEKNKELFREALKQPSPELEFKPPWASSIDAQKDTTQRETHHIDTEQKKREMQAIEESQNKKRYEEQIQNEKQQLKQAIAEQDETDRIERQNAIKTEAEQKRHEAKAVLHHQERSANSEKELESYRNQFRQAAEPTKTLDRDIEK